jgi:2-iminobutanoate/2-iminopropanoate deaminase
MLAKEVIATDRAPGAIGPYSQAVRCGDFIFCSGQVPLDPVSGQVVGTEVAEQTEQVLKNIQGLLSSVGLDLSAIVKTTVFLKNMGDFVTFNGIYEKHLRKPYPARSTVEVARLPKDVLVEIEATVFSPRG